MENQVSPQPMYGVLWFTARTEVDKESRMVTLEDLTISKTDFPTAPDGGAAYATALRQVLTSQPLTIALDRLQAELELERMEKPGQVVEANNAPRKSSSAKSRRGSYASMASRYCGRWRGLASCG